MKVPDKPAHYVGHLRHTRATFRTHDGALAVPVSWAKGHSLVRTQALTLDQSHLFRFRSHHLTKAARHQLRRLGASLTDVRKVSCEGYADYGGRLSYTLRLSLQRATAVCAQLHKNTPSIAYKSAGFGGSYPVIVGGRSSKRMENRAENRRVVIEVTRSGKHSNEPTAPDAPTLSGAVADDASATITFSASSDDGGKPVTGYQASTDGGATWQSLSTSGAGPYTATITGLANGTVYSVTVRSVNSVGTSDASNSLNVRPHGPAGPPVITSGAPNYNAGWPNAYADLTFTPPSQDGGSAITGYQYMADGGAWTTLTYTGSGTPYSARLTVLWQCQTFDYPVALRAINDDGPGATSNTWTVSFTDNTC